MQARSERSTEHRLVMACQLADQQIYEDCIVFRHSSRGPWEATHARFSLVGRKRVSGKPGGPWGTGESLSISRKWSMVHRSIFEPRSRLRIECAFTFVYMNF